MISLLKNLKRETSLRFPSGRAAGRRWEKGLEARSGDVNVIFIIRQKETSISLAEAL
jgi:hypothetical protein